MSIKTPRENKKNSWISLVVLLFFTIPELAIPIAIFCGIIWLSIKAVGKLQHTPAKKQPRKESFDECPQPLFCFHRDKGEHHVRRGKEIDPWDRPDIDISKYRRRN